MIKTMKKKAVLKKRAAPKKVNKKMAVLAKKAVNKVLGSVLETSNLTFGEAVAAMKNGSKVAREGWNGKGMWVAYTPGTPKANIAGTHYGKLLPKRKFVEILPHFDMFTVNAKGRKAMLPGWVASQSDIDTNDWCIVK